MKIFSENYGCYYNIIYKLLKDYSDISQKDIKDVIDREGFGESMLFLLPRLSQDEWELFGEARPDPVIPLSDYQKSWLRTILEDKRIGLFLNDEEIKNLKIELGQIEPLFNPEDIYYTDIFLDGDKYEDKSYRQNFRIIADAIHNKEIIDIDYMPSLGKRMRHYFIPLRLEYSIKNDAIRLYGLEEGKNKKLYILNLAKISEVRLSGRFVNEDDWPDFDKMIMKSYYKEPVTLLLKTERGTLERAMLHFASYKKNTFRYTEMRDDGFDGSRNEIYKCDIYYSLGNETELLINILSFGPTVKVIGNERFLKFLKDRLLKQKNMTF
ncbi:MAG: WYL domain-containing protein [Eubacterium sp.]|nr:WYL domain-containing protein [Eubacterium sp.]